MAILMHKISTINTETRVVGLTKTCQTDLRISVFACKCHLLPVQNLKLCASIVQVVVAVLRIFQDCCNTLLFAFRVCTWGYLLLLWPLYYTILITVNGILGVIAWDCFELICKVCSTVWALGHTSRTFLSQWTSQ